MAEEIKNDQPQADGIETKEIEQDQADSAGKKFKPIESQDELNAIIKARLDRQRTSYEKKIADLSKPDSAAEEQKKGLQDKIDELTAQLAESKKTIADYETASVKSRIASAYGIPAEFADRLKGSTEEELKADAEQFAAPFRKSYPQRDHSEPGGNADAGWLELARKLN